MESVNVTRIVEVRRAHQISEDKQRVVFQLCDGPDPNQYGSEDEAEDSGGKLSF